MDFLFDFLAKPSATTIIENVRNILIGVGAPIGLWLIYVRSRALDRQATIAENNHSLEKYTESIRLLESEEINLRISSVSTLKELMADDHRYYWSIVHVFVAYVNRHLNRDNEIDQYVDEHRRIVQQMIFALGDEKIHWIPFQGSSAALSVDLLGNSLKAIFTSLLGSGKYAFYRELYTQSQKNRHTVSFKNCDLEKMDFSSMVLGAAEFHKCILRKTYFSKSSFECAKFFDCEFEGARLLRSDFIGATFSRCGLKNADLTGSYFKRAVFDHCGLDGAKLSKARNLEFTGSDDA
jgi:hypothetical protein